MKKISSPAVSASPLVKKISSSVPFVIRDTFLTDDAAYDRLHMVRLHPIAKALPADVFVSGCSFCPRAAIT